jgi:alcohol dehydrogenase (cytochrome c)
MRRKAASGSAIGSRARILLPLCVAAALLALNGCGGGERSGADWPAPNFDLASTRANPAGGISAANVGALRPVWRFRFRIPTTDAGTFTATPVVAGGVVYIQDMKSNVFALDLDSGKLRWRHLFAATNPGPDGLTVAQNRVYGATDTTAFALSATTGRLLWSRFLVTPTQLFVDIAPQVADGTAYVSTVGLSSAGRGTLYALSAATGAVRWQFSTIKDRWLHPAIAGGGGSWYTPSLDGGTLYWGTANPTPWGGTPRYPNGAAFPGPVLYTDTLLVLDARRGRLLWHDQVTPHDIRDYDFQVPPIIGEAGPVAAVFGAGKAGIVIAWNRATHARLWVRPVGVHRNDVGPLPRRRVTVCPGLYGGVETPMAYAGGDLFVPVVDLCMQGSAVGYEPLAGVNVGRRGRGEFVALDAATGVPIWARRLPQAVLGCATAGNGVVFTSTFDGTVYAFAEKTGKTLWDTRMPAGINACPALAGGMLLLGAGIPRPGGRVELEAFAA